MDFHFLWVSVGLIFEKKLGNGLRQDLSLPALLPPSLEAQMLPHWELQAGTRTLPAQASHWKHPCLAPVLPLPCNLRVKTESKEQRHSSFLTLVPKKKFKKSDALPWLETKKEKRRRGNEVTENLPTSSDFCYCFGCSVTSGDRWHMTSPKN